MTDRRDDEHRITDDAFRNHLRAMGYDPDDPESLAEYRDMLKLMRKYYRRGKRAGDGIVWGVSIAAGAALFAGVVAAFRHVTGY